MALELAKRAEEAILEFYKADDALQQLGKLYDETLNTVEGTLKSGAKPVDFTHNVLDLAVQCIVEHLSWQLLTDPVATLETVGIPSLLDLCIGGVVKKYLINSAPYKVLEDLMEGQTISTCEKLWDLLETRKEKLATSDFIAEAGRTTKASLCLLKMCNALLRRLSKTHNSVFCGKILVFLSFTFALSERSAVNLMGKVNVNNVTVYEDEEEFDTAEATDSTKVSEVASAMEIDTNQKVVDAGPIDYNLYRTFWDLQRYFREHTVATQNAEEWEKCFVELDVVLSAFEGNAFSPDDLERSRDLMSSGTQSISPGDLADGSENISTQDHFFQPKYLTNSRLFRLQLRDPILRESMLTQFLILFNHLSKVKPPADSTTPKSKIVELQDRVMSLLKQTPSDGEGFSKMVTCVLERERNWIKWKQDKCPPYERYPDQKTTDGELSPTKKKKRLGDMQLPPRGMIKRARPAVAEDSVLLEQILTESSKPSQILEKIKGNERATEVQLEEYVERFKEAWDPENGIEEEYWPDKDKMHCWQTLRASMRNSVEHMDLAIRGAGAVVKGILGITDNQKNGAKDTNHSSSPAPTTDDNTAETKGDANGVNEQKVKMEQKDVKSSPISSVKRERTDSHQQNGRDHPVKGEREGRSKIKKEDVEEGEEI